MEAVVGYTKLFSDLVMSTIWDEPDHIRILWITMLSVRDEFHRVNASIPGLAKAARITTAQCEEALAKLSAPDPYSRTKDHEGRRIEEVDGGWIILNAEKYRNKMNEYERREYWRVKQQEYRNVNKRGQMSKTVIDSQALSTKSTQSESESESDTKDLPKGKSQPPAEKRLYALFEEFWKEYPQEQRIGKEAAKAIWRKLRPTDDLVKTIMAALAQHKKSEKWSKGIISSPAKWLSEGRWHDAVKLSWEHQTYDEGTNETSGNDSF